MAAVAVQLAEKAQSDVSTISGPLMALGIALLLLTITIVVVAYISSKVTKSQD